MMNTIRNLSRLIIVALLLTVCVSACKSKKKAMEASNAAAEKARIIEDAKAQKEAEQRKKEAEEEARLAAEARNNKELKTTEPKVRLSNYFNSIAGSGNTTSANNNIAEALTMFASPKTPVLIVISEEGGQKDYDKPTTIVDYLNYLKDQKKNMNALIDVQFDDSGKITEVELKKN